MYGVYAYIGVVWGVNVGIHGIHGAFGIDYSHYSHPFFLARDQPLTCGIGVVFSDKPDSSCVKNHGCIQ